MKPFFTLFSLVSLSILFNGCSSSKLVIFNSEDFSIEQITRHTYLHTTYLDIPNYGKFPCNGLLYHIGNEVYVFDTPPDNVVSTKLIKWIKETLGATVKAVIINHFHNDCLGGLAAFHDLNIPSYSTTTTQKLAKTDGMTVPTNGLDPNKKAFLKEGDIVLAYLGEAHTQDNIVAWLPKDKILFGGCMVKSVGAGKGNLADANVAEWANTIQKVKQVFPKVKYVVPGHGKYGGVELLNYTIELFSE